MADLKINQLDPIIPVSSGTGASYAALADGDLFIVKMKVRGTAIGDEDRKLTWLELRNSLNLGQYMGTIGGNFTGDITLNNNKAVKGQQTGSGADISLLYVDTSNRVVVGNTTNLTRIASSSVPQFVDGSGTYSFITSKNLPVPGDINAYTKNEVDSALALKANLSGADFTGNISVANNKAVNLVDAQGNMRNGLMINAANNLLVGDKTAQLRLSSAANPTVQVGTDATNYPIYHAGNKPSPGDLGIYTNGQVDSALALKVNKSGDSLTGSLAFANGQGISTPNSQGTSANMASASGDNLYIGDNLLLALALKSASNPTVQISSKTYTLYHTGNKPTFAELGVDTALALKMDKAGGTFSDTVTFANNVHVKSVSGASAQTPNASVDVFYSGTNALYVGDVQQSLQLRGYGDLTFNNGTVNTVYHTGNKPSAADVGSYTTTQADAAFARKGINADITALNGLTGALKVGANATQPMEVTTLQQVQALTSGTAGAVVGVVGGFVGAVMWFNGPRASVPAGWLPADGTTLNRADYPDLWASVSGGALANTTEDLWQNSGEASSREQQSNATQRGKYSTGDGSKTFRLPDLNGGQTGTIGNAFLRGFGTSGDQSNIGKMSLDGAPNITGNFSSDLNGSAWMPFPATNAYGAFFNDAAQTNSYHPTAGFDNKTETSRVNFDASRIYSGYGRTSTEIKPRAAVGIWIIRVSNNFVAANTNFAVYNGAATLPASGTVTNAGLLQSIYNVNGVQDHSMNLQSQRTVGQQSSVILTSISQAQGSLPAQSAQYYFGSSGNFIAPGYITGNSLVANNSVSAQTMELSSSQPFIDFHFGNSTADYTHRLIADTASRLWLSSNFRVAGDLATDSTLTGQQIVGRGLYVNGQSNLANNQGTHLVWNEEAGSGRGGIVVNPGTGTGGFRFRFVNAANSSQTGFVDITSTGIVEAGYGYRSKAGAGGATAANVWNIERGGNGSNYLWIDKSAFLIPDGSSDLTLKDNISKPKDGALDRVMASETIEYEWKDKAARGAQRRRGFGAQTQEDIDPMHVNRSEDSSHPLSLDTFAMLADAYDAIKELKGMVTDLSSQVAKLKAAQS